MVEYGCITFTYTRGDVKTFLRDVPHLIRRKQKYGQ